MVCSVMLSPVCSVAFDVGQPNATHTNRVHHRLHSLVEWAVAAIHACSDDAE